MRRQRMSEFLNLFDDDDEIIVCNTPKGDTIRINVFDVNQMITESVIEHGAENLNQQQKIMVDLFEKEYKFRMSRPSIQVLITKVIAKVEELKKNTPQQLGPVDSMESPPEVIENGDSSN